MATINGRYVKLLFSEGAPIGRVTGWREGSDWIMVTCLDGHCEQVHYTDKIEILPATFTPTEPDQPHPPNRAPRAKEKSMANVFEGKPDGRQAEGAIAVSRFRPRYRALTDDEKALHDEIKAKADELDALFAKVKPGRYNSLAVTSLETSVMWIIKELTS